MNRTIKLVADSSADTVSLTGVSFAAVPLKIVTAEREYVDDASLNTAAMVRELEQYSGRSSTACPSPGNWLAAFGDGEGIFCLTITSGLSGSYNAACIARRDYEEKHPGRRVCVIDSLSAGPELRLLLEKLRQLIADGVSFDDIALEIAAYQKHTALVFMLQSMRNLARNGRVSPLVAKAAGLLGIRVVGKASDHGTLEMLEKCRGEKKALDGILRSMETMGYAGGPVRISHCFGEETAETVRRKLLERFPAAQVELYPSRGLCSFYAEQGGLLVGFETAPRP